MIKEEEQYLVYIAEHQENVRKAFNQYIDNILSIMKNDSLRTTIEGLVVTHDRSKLSSDEFDDYRKKFFPTSIDKKYDYDITVKQDFDIAWLHHMNFNKHHPEYWVIRDSDGIRPLDMPREYIVEMILDWIAMGMAKNNTALDWFEKKNDYFRQIMSPGTYFTTKLVLAKLFGKEDR